MDKPERYRLLVEARKACTRCPELENPATVDDGKLDSDEIGPFARWQGNLDSPVVVVAQDFADGKSFRKKLRGWPGERVRTNLALVDLAREAGFTLSPPVRGQSDDVLFFTNAVLCLKKGRMSAPVPRRCFEECGRQFLRKTIELVNPRAVVTLGVGALRAIERAFDLKEETVLSTVIDNSPGFVLPSNVAVFPRYHPSPTVMNVARSAERQLADWQRIGEWVRLCDREVAR
jgi:uracil-DNA glycosylase